ncbi:phenylalanine--tRNA ligase subunit beta [Gammaproteobacteria bacterium]|nr:phenylalanine--tRNA ligase subunit beta [Gammaproteobacteria bacterium]
MKILYQDLVSFLAEKPSIDLLSEKLFQLGHEHEIDGEILDMELTPNRGDCLSLNGLARDLNVFFGSSNALAYYDKDIDALNIEFKNNTPRDCPKISFLEIEIDHSISDYKPYLENYFTLVGGNKTNLFTDVSNYISYELGQPTHCFDSEKINGEIVFANEFCNGNFETLLGSDIKLKDNNCVFKIENEIVSLAGVMGGSKTACSSNTTKVLVECAYFEPDSIIGKSTKYNLNSDAAYKFERGVDIGSQDLVLRRFIKIVQEHATITSLKTRSFRFIDFKEKNIPANFNKINQILGTDISQSEFIGILKKLNFNIENNTIMIPTHRHDIKSLNDIAEEIARVVGYDNIKSIPISLPKIEHKNTIDKTKHISNSLIASGFVETINFPFDVESDKSAIIIDNPLDINKSFLRTSLKPSLIESFIYNQRRQNESIKLFEISDIYSKNPEISNKKKLGVIAGGRQELNYKYFSKKITIEYFQNMLKNILLINTFSISEIPYTDLRTKKKDKVFYAEVFVNDIPEIFFDGALEIQKPTNFIKYKPVSEFPSSSRDLSFSVKNPESFSMVVEMLKNIKDDIISKSFIFDFYKNEKQKTIKIGSRIIFQSHKKTLSEEEVNKKINEIIKPIIEIDGVFIDGM